jgi:hypothetical protein
MRGKIKDDCSRVFYAAVDCFGVKEQIDQRIRENPKIITDGSACKISIGHCKKDS